MVNGNITNIVLQVTTPSLADLLLVTTIFKTPESATQTRGTVEELDDDESSDVSEIVSQSVLWFFLFFLFFLLKFQSHV